MLLTLLAFIFGGACLYLYLKNAYLAIVALRGRVFTVRTALRTFGIFFVVVGIFMGVV
jgi:hypothetical protein